MDAAHQNRKLHELERIKIDENLKITQGFMQSHDCSTCFAEFVSAAQLKSHCTAFHEKGPVQLAYRCGTCTSLFPELELFLQHKGCMDRNKQRLGIGDNCVCLLCGCAQLRPHLSAHFLNEHDWQLELIKVGLADNGKKVDIKCNMCSPPYSCKSKVSLLVHTCSIHSAHVTIEPMISESEQQCHLCSEWFSGPKFRQHVISAHCGKRSKRHLTRRGIEIEPKDNNNYLKKVRTKIQKKSCHLVPRARKSFVNKQRKISQSPAGYAVSESASDPGSNHSSVVPEDFGSNFCEGQPTGSVSISNDSCSFCSSVFSDREQLAQHLVMRVCQPLRIVMCSFCGTCVMNWQIWDHVIKEHNDLEQLGVSIRQSTLSLIVTGLDRHKQKDNGLNFPCHSCHLKFSKHPLQRLHMLLIHDDDHEVHDEDAESPHDQQTSSPPINSDSNKTAQCPFCSRKCHPQGLHSHVRKCQELNDSTVSDEHKANTSNDQQSSPPPLDDKSAQCPLCSLKCHPQRLYSHVRSCGKEIVSKQRDSLPKMPYHLHNRLTSRLRLYCKGLLNNKQKKEIVSCVSCAAKFNSDTALKVHSHVMHSRDAEKDVGFQSLLLLANNRGWSVPNLAEVDFATGITEPSWIWAQRRLMKLGRLTPGQFNKSSRPPPNSSVVKSTTNMVDRNCPSDNSLTTASTRHSVPATSSQHSVPVASRQHSVPVASSPCSVAPSASQNSIPVAAHQSVSAASPPCSNSVASTLHIKPSASSQNSVSMPIPRNCIPGTSQEFQKQSTTESILDKLLSNVVKVPKNSNPNWLLSGPIGSQVRPKSSLPQSRQILGSNPLQYKIVKPQSSNGHVVAVSSHHNYYAAPKPPTRVMTANGSIVRAPEPSRNVVIAPPPPYSARLNNYRMPISSKVITKDTSPVGTPGFRVTHARPKGAESQQFYYIKSGNGNLTVHTIRKDLQQSPVRVPATQLPFVIKKCSKSQQTNGLEVNLPSEK